MANLISETLGDFDEWLHEGDSLMQLRPWKSDEVFLGKFFKVKLMNKATLMEKIIDSVKLMKYENVVSNAMEMNGAQYIT